MADILFGLLWNFGSVMAVCLFFERSFAQSPALKFSTATNFAADIAGEPDSRPGCWGNAGVASWRITFDAPEGKRVRITRVYGDFVIWPRGVVPQGSVAGALFGLQTTAPEGSTKADYAADNAFVYLQLATNGKPERAPFDYQTDALLEPDHVLHVKTAVWLNDTGQAIHMEPTFVIQAQFEDDQKSVRSVRAHIARVK